MTAQFLLVYDVGMAGFADVVAGESRRAGCGFGNGRAAVVAILAKALGHDSGAQQDEDYQQDSDDDGKTDEMFGVLKHGCFPCADAGLHEREKAQ